MALVSALLALVALVALLAGGCSGAEESDPVAAQPGESADADDQDGPAALPFDAVLIEVLGTADTEWYAANAAHRVGALVKECMTHAGFEYSIPPTEPIGAPEDLRATRDWAAEYGFGVVSGFYDRLAADSRHIIDPDPNRRYLATLSGEEIERFLIALYGPQAEPGQLQTDRGCTGAAEDEAFADWNRLIEIMPNFGALAEERDTHPDWLEGRRRWQECMAAAGYDYAEPESISVDVRRRMSDLVEAKYPGGNLPLTPNDDGTFGVDPSVVPLLDELQQFEITVAVANADCLAEQADRFNAAEAAVQASFVEHNRDRIDQLRGDR